MNIIWVTVRRRSDFCSTTTTALSSGLVEAGHQLTLLSPDNDEMHADGGWFHVQLHQASLRGMQAYSLATSAIKWFSKNDTSNVDVVIIDWPLAPRLGPTLKKLNIQTLLMDRSPPADVSILGKLQWRIWKQAWKLVQQGVIGHGSVVSRRHLDFVKQHVRIHDSRLHVIPAGVNLELFTPSKKPKISKGLRLIYHGRLDKHRGILSLPMLVQKLVTAGVKANLTLVGEGDAVASLKKIERNMEWMEVHSYKEQSEVATILSKQHVGILPMPKTTVWSLASPLKRSEYIASGLLVLGIKHSGHALDQADPSWFHLLAQHDFQTMGIEWLVNLTQEQFDDGSKLARAHALNKFSWTKSVDSLNDALYCCKQNE